jgi:hypothetical protein
VSTRAMFVSRLEHLSHWQAGYDRLYYGNEFCERLIPTADELRAALKFAGERGVPLTLVTPYVTEHGMARQRELFDIMSGDARADEVVFNEWGVLRVLHNDYSGLTPVMGRLLNRMKRGPRLMTVIDKLPPTTVRYFRDNHLNNPALNDFLKEHGVGRVELDNLLQGFDFELEKLRGTIYTPYVYVSTTRLCLSAGCEDPSRTTEVTVGAACQRECRRYTFHLRHSIMPVPLIRKGAAIFYHNAREIPDLGARGIDRIVVQPEIPI